MQSQASADAALEVSSSQHGYHAAVQLDLEFLRAWEDGHFPNVCCHLRVRQIRKGNPILIAEQLARTVNAQTTRPAM